MCVYAYVCTVFASLRTCVRVSACVREFFLVVVCARGRVCSCSSVRVFVQVSVRACVRMRPCVRAYLCICVCRYVSVCGSACMYALVHTFSCVFSLVLFRVRVFIRWRKFGEERASVCAFLRACERVGVRVCFRA